VSKKKVEKPLYSISSVYEHFWGKREPLQDIFLVTGVNEWLIKIINLHRMQLLVPSTEQATCLNIGTIHSDSANSNYHILKKRNARDLSLPMCTFVCL
jgi:hypothetical protein